MATVRDVARRLDASRSVASVHKGSTSHGQVPDLLITSHGEIPSLHQRPRASNQHIFEADAKQVVDALWESLPGGTLDQILRLMLERKASQLVVPHHYFGPDPVKE